METSIDPAAKKSGFWSNDDKMIILIIIGIAAIYMLTGFLIEPSVKNDCGQNIQMVEASSDSMNPGVTIIPKNKLCVYKKTVEEKCITFNQHLTICNDNVVNTLLQGK